MAIFAVYFRDIDMKRWYGASLLLLGLLIMMIAYGCQSRDEGTFVVEGKITGAEGKMLYLEEVGTGNLLSLDSIKLGADGQFVFKHPGTSYPMFYNLRLEGATIPFCADSLTHLVMQSKADDFFRSYTLIEGDPYNHQIREVVHTRMKADKAIDSVDNIYRAGGITPLEATTSIDSIADALRVHLSTHYIYLDPKSPTAYFALFQRKGDIPYFTIDREGDERTFAAVATAYETYYPNAPYTPFLKDIALKGMAFKRMRRELQSQKNPTASDSTQVR